MDTKGMKRPEDWPFEMPPFLVGVGKKRAAPLPTVGNDVKVVSGLSRPADANKDKRKRR